MSQHNLYFPSAHYTVWWRPWKCESSLWYQGKKLNSSWWSISFLWIPLFSMDSKSSSLNIITPLTTLYKWQAVNSPWLDNMLNFYYTAVDLHTTWPAAAVCFPSYDHAGRNVTSWECYQLNLLFFLNNVQSLFFFFFLNDII